MSAASLLDELHGAGISLSPVGDDLRYQTRPGVSIAPFRERIQQHKPAILAELLQREIVAAATVEPGDFDRDRYDRLWVEWHALAEQQPADTHEEGGS